MKKVISIPPVYLFLSLFFSVAFFYLLPSLGLIEFPYNIFGLVVLLAGVFLNQRSWLLFRKHKTTFKFEKSTYFMKEGLYKYSRNPMYLGMVLLLLGIAICLGNLVSLVPPVLFFVVIDQMFIPYEEEKMENTFGDEYLDYKGKVKRWL
ncbi:MAG: isoprenylcysteine carboxylmethyltransferase family protein [Candidatus Pacebacteria bacterium]|nr:isoprenylcysteine carboxylmethyltransferase family protein [Candidatus Paceibacterota bacterium]